MFTITALMMTEGPAALKDLYEKITSTGVSLYTYLSELHKGLPDSQHMVKRAVLERSFSMEDLAMQLELQSQHPFVKAMQALRQMFGPQWPPRASFEDWPASWGPYKQMAENMSYKLRDLESPALFRQWTREVSEKINVDEIVAQIGELLERDGHNTAVFGLMGALAKIIFAYRWGCLPATEEERNRKTLEFPPQLMKPFEKMSSHYGTILRGCMFSTCFANSVYEDNHDGPTRVRFFFTTEELMRETETNFFNSFTHMDLEFGKTLPYMSRYMALTDVAKKSGTEMAKRLLQERVHCLLSISEHIKDMFKVFRYYINERKVKKEYWAPYIQAATAWNINGMTEGMSGAETLAFQLLDAFLAVKGNSPVYQASIKKLQTLPAVCRDLIAALNEDATDRFNTFLDLEDDSISLVKEEILSCLFMWRLGHAKIPARYFNAANKTTSGGVVENVGETEGTLVEITERQLRQRAMETKDCMKSMSEHQQRNPM